MYKPYELQVAICEDNQKDLAALKDMIDKTGIAAACFCFESGEAFLESFCVLKYDLIFMDIYMRGVRGLETVEAIRSVDQTAVIAFVTSSPDHTRESYKLGALKYIEKPVTEKEVLNAMELALAQRNSRQTVSLAAAGGVSVNILLDAVVYFEQQQHVIEIHTVSGVIKTSQGIKMHELEKRLPSPPFLRCHRSYLVNLDYVQRADKEANCFYMKNDDRVDIRRGEFTRCKAVWQNRCMDKAVEV